MRTTKRFERRINTPYFKIGELKSVVGNGVVSIEASAGIPFDVLKIKGATEQRIPNLIEPYFADVKNADSYRSGGVTGAYLISLPSELVNKKLTYELKGTATPLGVSLYLSDGESLLFSNLTPLCDSRGNTYSVSGDTFTHLVFTNVYTSDKEDENGDIVLSRDGIIDFWQSYDISVTGGISPEYYSSVLNMGDSGSTIEIGYDSITRRSTLPTSIKYGALTARLLFSEYDEIEIDRKKQKVIYKDGALVVDLTGEEGWQIQPQAVTQGRGMYAFYNLQDSFTEGYCPYLTFACWMPPASAKNVFSSVNEKNVAIKLENNETSIEYVKVALAEITDFLKEKQAAGLGVKLVLKRKSVIERDISSTALAKALLNLKIPKGKDGTLTVRGRELFASIEAKYYSLVEGEKSTLTVLCKNERGDEIASAREYILRRGSAYKLCAPQIDGYEPKESELWGGLKNDKTIIIEYEEKK